MEHWLSFVIRSKYYTSGGKVRILMNHHPIDPWTLYAHTHSTSNTYVESFTHVATMESLEDWAGVWNNCHPDLVGNPNKSVLVNGNRISSWSLFRGNIKPKWEHPMNKHGTTITHRTNVDEIDARDTWRDLVLECIRGALPDYILGVQVTQKPSRHTTFVKFDVWLSADVNLSHARDLLRNLTELDFVTSIRTSHTDEPRRMRVVKHDHSLGAQPR